MKKIIVMLLALHIKRVSNVMLLNINCYKFQAKYKFLIVEFQSLELFFNIVKIINLSQ